jgi:hypothetical protein
MHEGEDEEMMRVVSNGTRFRVPLTLAHLPPSQHSPDLSISIPSSSPIHGVGSTPLLVTRRSLFSVLFPLPLTYLKYAYNVSHRAHDSVKH